MTQGRVIQLVALTKKGHTKQPGGVKTKQVHDKSMAGATPE